MENKVGEIYLKTVPDKISVADAQEHNKFGEVLSSTFGIASGYNIQKPGDDDYEHMDEIMICTRDEREEVILKAIDPTDSANNRFEYINISKEELNEKYITFRDFLKDAKFVGKWGEILDPETNYSTSIMENRAFEDVPVVLYNGKTHNIALQRNGENEYMLDVINKAYYDTWEYSFITDKEFEERPGLKEFLQTYSNSDLFLEEINRRMSVYAVGKNSESVKQSR